MDLGLSQTVYILNALRTAQRTIEALDPLAQFAGVALLAAFVSQGNLMAFIVIMGVAVYLRMQFLGQADADARKAGPALEEGDASKITKETLLDELRDLDPDGKRQFLWSLPEVFHALHQVAFLRELARPAFERVLDAADAYADASLEIKRSDNLPAASAKFRVAIDRAAEVVENMMAVGLEFPLATDPNVLTRHRDAVKTLRIVLRRDLVVLRQAVVRVTQRSTASFDVIDELEGPRPYENTT